MPLKCVEIGSEAKAMREYSYRAQETKAWTRILERAAHGHLDAEIELPEDHPMWDDLFALGYAVQEGRVS